jgi:anti-sigma factor RsiW
MTDERHEAYAESAGAYLLDALSELEERAFEHHLADCAACREEIERLRPAAEALPRSVPPVAPPPSLKISLMATVEEEAGVKPRSSRAGFLRRLVPPGRMRPAVAWASACFLLVAGVVAGFGVASLVSGDGTRTISARVDSTRVPMGGGSLAVASEDRDGAVLRVHGMPALDKDTVYEVWLQREGEVVAQSLFTVGGDGDGAGAVKDDLEGADAVLVTREPRGGARAPSERPIMRVKL